MAYYDYITETVENEFLGIKVPKYEFFNIHLKQTRQAPKPKKNQTPVFGKYGFDITIDAQAIGNESKTLSQALQTAFERSYPNYNYANKSYRYYTSRYDETTDEQNKQKLQNILDTISQFEAEFKKVSSKSIQQFKTDAAQNMSYADHEVIVKFNEKLQSFLVLPITFIGTDKFKLLANASKQQGEVGITEHADTEFFSDLLPPRKKIQGKKFFIINPVSYFNIKDLIEKKIEQKNEFLEIQDKFSQEFKGKSFDIVEDNPFNLKIVYDENIKCFEFYCKGYSQSLNSFTGNYEDRSVLARMALNSVLCEDKIGDEPGTHNEYDLIDGKKKIELEFKEESSKRDKRLLVSAEQWRQIEKIYNNYHEQKENTVWGRPEVTQKVYDKEIAGLNSNMRQYPSIYFDNKGKCYLIHSLRSSTRGKQCTHLKGFEISYPEAMHFMNEYDMADKIHFNSLLLNSEVWLPQNNEPPTHEQRKEIFDTVLLHAQLNHDNPVQNVKKKRVKI